MTTSISTLVGELRAALADQLRGSLEKRDKEWLIEEVIRLKLKNATLGQILQIEAQLQQQEREAKYAEATAREQSTRLERIHALQLDEDRLATHLKTFAALDRAHHEQRGHLVNVPAKGGVLITHQQRSAAGNALLCDAK